MDTGVQLGRRFRALKLWMVLRSFGARGDPRAPDAAHRARAAARRVDRCRILISSALAPVPFSVVCFRWNPAGAHLPDAELDAANERIIDAVNGTGEVFMSHTRLNGRLALRIAIGHLHTTEQHVRRAWDLIVEHAASSATSHS